MRDIICQAVDITVGYGRKTVLEGLSLDLEKGSCTLIVGANGCGKSTLFSAMAGIKQIKRGQFLWKGKEIEKNSLEN